MTILDQVARSARNGGSNYFRPSSASECFALRLAQKLGDQAAARHYVELLKQYSEGRLIAAFRRASTLPQRDRVRIFHSALRELGAGRNGYNGGTNRSRLTGIRIERRSVAVVVMNGDMPEHVQVRQLSSTKDKAVGSALAFVNQVIELFPFPSAAIEPVFGHEDEQRSVLTQSVIQMLREHPISLWEVRKQELFEGFGHPPLKTRKELRAVIASIWPILNGGFGGAFVRDAAALASYCQTERLFINSS